MGHSILAPSAAHIWAPCPGSVLMQLMYPEDESSEQSTEGTEAHGVAMDKISDINGTPSGRDYSVLPSDMVAGAEMYANDVVRAMRVTRVFGGHQVGIEKRVSCAMVHPECYGTPDTYVFDSREWVLHVWDYKYGRGVVEVHENLQLILYAAGALAELGVDPDDNHVDIVLTIVQPRAHHRDGPIRRWNTTGPDLTAYLDTLRDAAAAALGDDPKCLPGAHCTHCLGRHACEAAERLALLAVDFIGGPSPLNLSPEFLGLEARMLEDAATAVKNRLTGLHAEIEHLIRGGTRIPGYTMTPSNTHRRWLGAPDEIVALGVPAKPVSPAQAEAAGIDPNVILAHTEKPAGKLKLKRDDGTRARMIFEQKAI